MQVVVVTPSLHQLGNILIWYENIALCGKLLIRLHIDTRLWRECEGCSASRYSRLTHKLAGYSTTAAWETHLRSPVDAAPLFGSVIMVQHFIGIRRMAQRPCLLYLIDEVLCAPSQRSVLALEVEFTLVSEKLLEAAHLLHCPPAWRGI